MIEEVVTMIVKEWFMVVIVVGSVQVSDKVW